MPSIVSACATHELGHVGAWQARTDLSVEAGHAAVVHGRAERVCAGRLGQPVHLVRAVRGVRAAERALLALGLRANSGTSAALGTVRAKGTHAHCSEAVLVHAFEVGRVECGRTEVREVQE
jgi:hypothetical protein